MTTFTIAPVQRAHHGSHFRAYGLRGMAELINPFVNVDHAWMSAPTFPPHPHAGFSAVSYVFLDSEAGIENRDNIGTHNLIRPGGLHWTTAGRGIVHEEIPAEVGKTVHSLQIFVGLEPQMRGIEPSALSLEPEEVPVVQLPGVKVRVPVGDFNGVRSSLVPPTDVTMLDISLDESAETTIPVVAGDCAFIMPIAGVVAVDGHRFDPNGLRLPVFAVQDTPSTITIQAFSDKAKVMVFAGRPLHS